MEVTFKTLAAMVTTELTGQGFAPYMMIQGIYSRYQLYFVKRLPIPPPVMFAFNG